MRSSRVSSMREAERRRKAETEQHNCAGITGSINTVDTYSLPQPVRLDSVAGSAYDVVEPECGTSDCFSSPSQQPNSQTPSITLSRPIGHISAPDCDACDGSGMNTLAAQTVACSGGSSYSINAQPKHCECSHENGGNRIRADVEGHRHHRHHHHHHCDDDDDKDVLFCSSPEGMRAQQEMRWELRYYFMNPYLKYQKRGRKPWKLSIQVLKIIFVTTQLILFGTSTTSLNEFYDGNRVAFEHLFLEDWDPAYDSRAYPRTNELYAIYELQSLYKHLDHVACQFARLKENALGTYGYDRNEGETRKLHVWQQNYLKINITDKGVFELDLDLVEESLVYTVEKQNKTCDGISVKDYLEEHNQTIDADRLRILRLNFVIASLHLRDSTSFSIPDCIKFNITIEYDNKAHNGRIPITLKVKHTFFNNCSQSNKPDEDDDLGTTGARLTLAMDSFIIFLCILSAIMCIRSFVKAQHLKLKTMRFFKNNYNVDLGIGDRLEFLNLWYVLIIVNDACTIAGTINKILIECRNNTDYDKCSLLLGMGCFLVWFGVLRYLSFFGKYNILILTLKSAMPNVLRFLICTGIIYAAYTFFGWIVLGPYHPKFRTLSRSVECMYSLINGDDMYATFREMADDNPTIYFFSIVYLYTFISLFIYVILSLIIAVIMDTYETIKECQRTGHLEGRLHSFMAETCDDDIPGRGSFHTQSSLFDRSWSQWQWNCRRAVCCRRCNSSEDGNYDDLIT